jgi:sporulation protein YlmC with PRC-barrel domain
MSTLDLARDVLDSEIFDSEGTLCGRVDNIEMETGPGAALHVKALLVGSRAFAPRLPALAQRLLELCGARGQVRVPWAQVERVENGVRLRCRGGDLGLGRVNRKAGRLLARLPRS